MNPLPLTPTQLAELSVLVARNRLRAMPVDLGKAQLFLDQSLDAMTELSNIKANKVRYDTAYNAAHDVGEALLAAYGYRTASGPGQHTAVGEFFEIIFAGGPAQSAAGDFDPLRDGSNGVRYQAKPIGKAQADFAGVTAQALLDEAQVIPQVKCHFHSALEITAARHRDDETTVTKPRATFRMSLHS